MPKHRHSKSLGLHQALVVVAARMRRPLCPRSIYTHSHHYFHQTIPTAKSLIHICSISNSIRPEWSSNTKNLIITNPTLQLLEECSTMSQLKQIQAQMIRSGLFFHIFPVSRIISFCALSTSADINYAHLVFKQISAPNVYIWNTMIRGYCKARNPMIGLCFFKRMIRESVEMDSRSFVFALKAYGQLSGIQEGLSIYSSTWKLGFDSDLLVQNELIHYLGNNGFLSYARKVFDECFIKDVVTWTAMIDGYVEQRNSDEALRLFDLMVRGDVAPNHITMVAVLSACAQKGDLSLGKSLCEYIEKNDLILSQNLVNALLDMYVKCGCVNSAREYFEMMEYKDVFSWTTMVNGYAKHGELAMAKKLFNEMPEKNVVSWNAIIAGHSQNNQPREAIELFHDMVQSGLVPIEATLVSVVSACAQTGCLELGNWLHKCYINQSQINMSIILANAFIDMYAKCGCIDVAEELFNQMTVRDLSSWNSIIIGLADHGLANKAIMLFEKMKDVGIRPDDITYVGVLSACSHCGLVNKAQEYFRDMKNRFGLEPKVEHYACMVDVLGRVGSLEGAYNLMKKMPMKPEMGAWGALLNACRMHGNAELGKIAAEKLIELDPRDSGIYIVLANLCSSSRKWGDVRTVRTIMRKRGVNKTPGRSFIEVDGQFHEFLVADDSHPRSHEIRNVLNGILFPSKWEDILDKSHAQDYYEVNGTSYVS